MAGYLVRRPLAAIVSALVMGLVSLPFMPGGVAIIFGYLIGGVLAELSYAAGRYRTYTLPFMMSIGLIYNLIGVGLIWVPLQVGSLTITAVVGVFALSAVMGLVGGWLTKTLGDALLNSGVMTINIEEVEPA